LEECNDFAFEYKNDPAGSFSPISLTSIVADGRRGLSIVYIYVYIYISGCWWAACLGLQGQKERMQSQLVNSGLLLICKTKQYNLGLSLVPSMTEAIGCNLAMFIFSYNFFKKNEDTQP
jgi:hypothetical protein